MAEKLRALFLRWGDFVQTLTQPEQAKPDNDGVGEFRGAWLMSYLEMCIEELNKQKSQYSFDDIDEQDKAIIIDKAVAGLNQLGGNSIRTKLGQTQGLTYSDFVTFAISSAYWFIRIEQGVFPNALKSDSDVRARREKAEKSKDKAKNAIGQLEKALAAMNAAISSFPMGSDGVDEYAQMYARWNTMIIQLEKDIQSQRAH